LPHTLYPATLGNSSYGGSMKKLFGLLFFSALTFSLSGCAQQIETWDGSGSMSVFVVVQYNGGDFETAGAPCQGSDKSPDIRSGATATLRDSAGVVVSLSQLEGGKLTTGYVDTEGNAGFFSGDNCVFDFQFIDVESDDKFFSVEIGSRGEVNITREDLELGLVALSLN